MDFEDIYKKFSSLNGKNAKDAKAKYEIINTLTKAIIDLKIHNEKDKFLKLQGILETINHKIKIFHNVQSDKQSLRERLIVDLIASFNLFKGIKISKTLALDDFVILCDNIGDVLFGFIAQGIIIKGDDTFYLIKMFKKYTKLVDDPSMIFNRFRSILDYDYLFRPFIHDMASVFVNFEMFISSIGLIANLLTLFLDIHTESYNQYQNQHQHEVKQLPQQQEKQQVIDNVIMMNSSPLSSKYTKLEGVKELCYMLIYNYLWCIDIDVKGPFKISHEKIKYKTTCYNIDKSECIAYVNQIRKYIIDALRSLIKYALRDKNVEMNIQQLMQHAFETLKVNHEYWINIHFPDDYCFELNTLERLRLIVLFDEFEYTGKRNIYYHENNQFIWDYIQEGLVSLDNTLKKMAYNLLENIHEKEREYLETEFPNEKQFIQAYIKIWKTFFNLSKTLDSYPVHLIKGIFSTYEILNEEISNKVLVSSLQRLKIYGNANKIIKIYDVKWLMSIILNKISIHPNNSVTKYVIKSFMKMNINIDELQGLIYNDLISILNLAILYDHNNNIQKDSKFFNIIQGLFVRYYDNLGNEELAKHFKLLLKAIYDNVYYQSTYIGLFSIFNKYAKYTHAFDHDDYNLLLEIMKKLYKGLNLRRENQIFTTIVNILIFHMQNDKLDVKDILKLLSCISFDSLILTYKINEYKPNILTIIKNNKIQFEPESSSPLPSISSPVSSSSSLSSLSIIQSNFNLLYKLFIWLYLHFDIDTIINEFLFNSRNILSDITTARDYIQPSLSLICILNCIYELSSEDLHKWIKSNGISNDNSSTNPSDNAIFILKMLERKENTVYQNFSHKLNEHILGLYRNPYLKKETVQAIIYVYNVLINGLLKINKPNIDYVLVKQTDLLGPEIFAYSFYKLKELSDITDKDDLEHDEAYEMLPLLLLNTFLISIKSQYTTIKCSLLTQARDYTKEFYKGHLLAILSQENINFIYLNYAIQIFTSILKAYLIVAKEALQLKKEFILDKDIFTYAYDLLSKIYKLNPTGQTINRAYATTKQHYIVNAMKLLYLDPATINNPSFVELNNTILDDISMMIDTQDFSGYKDLMEFLKVTYMPSLLRKLDNANKEEVDDVEKLLSDYKDYFKRILRNILDSEQYKYEDIKVFYDFAIDSMLLENDKFIKSNIFYDLFKHIVKLNVNYPFVLRLFINKLYHIFLTNPQIICHYMPIIKKLLTIREYRGFESEIYNNYFEKQSLIELKDKQALESITISYNGAYPRFMMLALVDEILNRFRVNVFNKVKDLTNDYILNIMKFYDSLILKLIKATMKGNPNDMVMPYSDAHRKRLYIGQALCVLSKYLKSDLFTALKSRNIKIEIIKHLENNIWKLLQFNNLPTIRQYLEIFSFNFISEFPEITMQNLANNLAVKTNKAQYAISLAFISGFYLYLYPESNYSSLIFKEYFPLVASNTAYIRAIAQFFATYYLRKINIKDLNESSKVMQGFYEFFIKNTQKLNMAKKFEEIIEGYKEICQKFNLSYLLSSKFDEYGEIIHGSVIDQIKEECIEILNQIKYVKSFYVLSEGMLVSFWMWTCWIGNEDDVALVSESWVWVDESQLVFGRINFEAMPDHKDLACTWEDNPPPNKEDLWKIYLNHLLENVKLDDTKFGPKEQITNYQKKVENTTNDRDMLIQEVQSNKPKNKSEMIIVATLLDKIPNFANLTRTCEVFGVTQLVVPNIRIVEDEAFKTISVTAEKWLPMIEVREKDLLDYLKFKKLSGYTLIGLEQTRESKRIENFVFPDKCVLLLGNEKEGTPTEYIQVMDAYIEIPQFGYIRSLNVHISAVICIWECVKQKKCSNTAGTGSAGGLAKIMQAIADK